MKIYFKVKASSFVMLSLLCSNLVYSASLPLQNSLEESRKNYELSQDFNKKIFEENTNFVENKKKEIAEDKLKLAEIKKDNNIEDYLHLINEQLISLRNFLVNQHEKATHQKFENNQMDYSMGLKIIENQKASIENLNKTVKEDDKIK